MKLIKRLTNWQLLSNKLGYSKTLVEMLALIKTGWGGRDRTYECRNQNPVPYHLATPQFFILNNHTWDDDPTLAPQNHPYRQEVAQKLHVLLTLLQTQQIRMRQNHSLPLL